MTDDANYSNLRWLWVFFMLLLYCLLVFSHVCHQTVGYVHSQVIVVGIPTGWLGWTCHTLPWEPWTCLSNLCSYLPPRMIAVSLQDDHKLVYISWGLHFFVLMMSTIFWLRLIQLWDPFHAYEDNSASLSNGLGTLMTLDLWGTGALFFLSSTYASHGCHQTMWDIHAQATAGRLWWSDGWAGCLSWFHACHDLDFLLSIWGLLLSMFLKLQVQGQIKKLIKSEANRLN